MKRCISLLALGLLTMPAGAMSSGEEWLVVPGERIGRITIGIEHAKVLALLGTPNREDDLRYHPPKKRKDEFKGIVRDDWTTPLPISEHPESGEGVFMNNFVTIYCKDRIVVQIEVRAPRFKTKDGDSTASTGNELEARFPHYEQAATKFDHPSSGGWPAAKHFVTFEDAVKEGIAWRYGVMGDAAPTADRSQKLETLIVHTPGMPMIMDPDGGGSRFMWKDNPHAVSTEH